MILRSYISQGFGPYALQVSQSGLQIERNSDAELLVEFFSEDFYDSDRSFEMKERIKALRYILNHYPLFVKTLKDLAKQKISWVNSLSEILNELKEKNKPTKLLKALKK